MLTAGILFYALYHELIIIRNPFTTQMPRLDKMHAKKHMFTLMFWKDRSWQKEKIELIHSDNKAQTLQYLIASWLGLLDDEQMLPRKISLQSVMLDSSGKEAYVSFDGNPLAKKSSIFDKWLWAEGLLKTIRENNIALTSIQFLVHHQPLADPHLDFFHLWPITGFLPATA